VYDEILLLFCLVCAATTHLIVRFFGDASFRDGRREELLGDRVRWGDSEAV
jgi:hypothetical protein